MKLTKEVLSLCLCPVRLSSGVLDEEVSGYSRNVCLQVTEEHLVLPGCPRKRDKRSCFERGKQTRVKQIKSEGYLRDRWQL